MENCLKIGSDVSKDSAKALGDLIDRVFTSAAKNRMDQDTVRSALSLVASSLSVNGTTVTNCNFTGEKILN